MMIQQKPLQSFNKKWFTQLSQSELNESQQQAVYAITQNDQITIVHGPPGTGKTTTLIEAIIQLVRMVKRYWYLRQVIQR
jgi:superfamily II DNA or RNA helicase